MNEGFISNLRKIIEQNLEVYKTSQSDLCAKGRKSLEYIFSMTQKQLVVLQPTVLLTRYEPTQTEGPEYSIQSTHSEFIGFDDDNLKMREGNIHSNVKKIRNLIETEDDDIPFIDDDSQTLDKLIMTKEKKKEKKEKKEIDNSKNRKGKRTKHKTSRKTPSRRSTPMTLQSSGELFSCNPSPLDNLQSEIFPQTKTIGEKDVDGEEKRITKTSLRTRKPVMSASYYDAVEPAEPSTKKRRKSKQGLSNAATLATAQKGFLKIDPLPKDATVSEVQIKFPLVSLGDSKFKISIDLEKISLESDAFPAIKSPPKRRRRSNAKNNCNESTPAKKSDLVKYLEIFSSGCENQNFDSSDCGSPISNNNLTMSTINFQDQNSTPPIADIVIVQPNQNPRIGNVISMDSSDVIIDESARQLLSNQLDKDAGLAEPAPINNGLNTSNASAEPAATTDGTQMEDFGFPLDIDNSVYRLYQYIENGEEIFNQTNINQQPLQSENVVQTLSSSSINNTNNIPSKLTIQQSNINVKDTKENNRKRQSPVQVDLMPVSAVNNSILPEFCENRNQAHSQRSASRYSFICKDVLDLSVQKAKGNKLCQSDSVMDLTVSASYPESLDKEQENITESYKNLIDLPRNTPQILENGNAQRISLEEYQRRKANTEKTVPQALEVNTTEKKKEPIICNKDCVACEDVHILNNSIAEYEFDEHSSTSGIYSEDCGTKSAGKNSKDCTPSYKEDEDLRSFHEIEDDTISIYINSAGSPFHFSECNAEDDDRCNSVSENRDELVTPPLPKISCDTNERPATEDTQFRSVANGFSGSNKIFKIPKLGHPTSKPATAVNNTSVLNDLESNLIFPTTQTTSSDFCVKPEIFTFTSQPLPQSVEKNVYNRKDSISDIFGSRPCFMYLAGNCQKPNCKFSHEIIDCNVLRMRLSNVNNMTLNSGYSFIARNKNLFRLYFSAFCEVFSQRGDRKKLMGMIHDCQLYKETISCFNSIVSGFMKTGLSQVDAVKIIKENYVSATPEAIDILVELMVDSDVTQFVSTLESYVTNPRYKFKPEAIDKLAFKCNRTKNMDVVQLLLKIILFQIPKQEIKNLQSAELMKFLDMVHTSHMTTTVQNAYKSCVNDNRPDKIFDELCPPAAPNSSSRPTSQSMSLPPSSATISSLLNKFIKRP